MPMGMRMTLAPCGTLVASYTEDVEPVLKHNKALYTHNSEHRARKPGDLRHVATIPEIVVYLWRQMYGFDLTKFRQSDEKKLKQILNDNEWLHLRVHPGRL